MIFGFVDTKVVQIPYFSAFWSCLLRIIYVWSVSSYRIYYISGDYYCLFLLRLLVQSPDEVEEGIGGDDVVEGFGAALGVDGVADVGEVAEDVETVELKEQVAVHEAFGEAGIPHEFVGVHRSVVVSSARIHGQVRGELEVPGQFHLGGEAIVEVEDVEIREVHALAGGVLIVEVALGRELHLVSWTPCESQLIIEEMGGDNAPCSIYQIHASLVAMRDVLLQSQAFVAHEWEVCTYQSVGRPVAVDVR